MRTVQLMSMMKLMLPPVVSSGQYQIMESSMAMEEHMPMTVRAMIGPQWNSLLTSWRFSNTIIADRIFIVSVDFSVFKVLSVTGEIVRRVVCVYCSDLKRSKGIFSVFSEITSDRLRHQSQGPAVS